MQGKDKYKAVCDMMSICKNCIHTDVKKFQDGLYYLFCNTLKDEIDDIVLECHKFTAEDPCDKKRRFKDD